MGFDLFNSDFDEPGQMGLRYAWSGVSRQNNDNPSEWGTLILAKKQSKTGPIVIITCLIIILVGGFSALRSWRNKREQKRQKDIAHKKPVYSEATKKVIEHLNTAYDREISVEEMARIAGLSQAWFSTTFKKETGVAASEYLIEIRIIKACELLNQTRKSVSEICYAVGFKDQSHFTKVFKRIMGMTPLDYRKDIAHKTS
jgi:AraC-like DNA-binding protein